jgi:hypothetical protein
MKTRVLILTLVLALSLMVAGVALANGGVEQLREVLSGGASDSAAGGVALRATLGQPVVGVVSGGNVTLGQGFWHGGAAAGGGYEIYLPLVLRNA